MDSRLLYYEDYNRSRSEVKFLYSNFFCTFPLYLTALYMDLIGVALARRISRDNEIWNWILIRWKNHIHIPSQQLFKLSLWSVISSSCLAANESEATDGADYASSNINRKPSNTHFGDRSARARLSKHFLRQLDYRLFKNSLSKPSQCHQLSRVHPPV